MKKSLKFGAVIAAMVLAMTCFIACSNVGGGNGGGSSSSNNGENGESGGSSGGNGSSGEIVFETEMLSYIDNESQIESKIKLIFDNVAKTWVSNSYRKVTKSGVSSESNKEDIKGTFKGDVSVDGSCSFTKTHKYDSQNKEWVEIVSQEEQEITISDGRFTVIVEGESILFTRVENSGNDNGSGSSSGESGGSSGGNGSSGGIIFETEMLSYTEDVYKTEFKMTAVFDNVAKTWEVSVYQKMTSLEGSSASTEPDIKGTFKGDVSVDGSCSITTTHKYDSKNKKWVEIVPTEVSEIIISDGRFTVIEDDDEIVFTRI